MAVLLYLTPYLFLILAMTGAFLGNGFAFLGILGVFVLHPLLDNLLFKKLKRNSQVPSLQKATFVLLLPLPVLCIFSFVGIIHSLQASSLELIGMIVSFGAIHGLLGITTAHELIHHKNPSMRFAGNVLLALVNFSHYSVSHVFVHHKNVGTPLDPATAKKNEWIYPYFMRSFLLGYIEALKSEEKRLKNSYLSIFKNRVLRGTAAQLILNYGVYLVFGKTALIFWLGQSAVAIVLLKTADYIEHYGLIRKKSAEGIYESVKAEHSWDSYLAFTNYTLINLGYHSHHHLKPTLAFTELQVTEKSQRLPYGYSAMALLALVPPLFFRVMNGRLPQSIGDNT